MIALTFASPVWPSVFLAVAPPLRDDVEYSTYKRRSPLIHEGQLASVSIFKVRYSSLFFFQSRHHYSTPSYLLCNVSQIFIYEAQDNGPLALSTPPSWSCLLVTW